MRFVHIADMHFDTPFRSLESKKNLGDIRRLEQRKVFKKVIEYIKENNIEYFFISGDLYDQDYVKETTIEYINGCFKEIPNTKIFISPGNHDPYTKDSYYNQYIWEKNVCIFNKTNTIYKFDNVCIYGYGFESFSENGFSIKKLEIKDRDIVNILVIHGNLNASLEDSYNPISLKELLNAEFDYVALGHIHKPENIENKVVYPGSLISLGFDELGEHGMVVGEVTKAGSTVEFIPLDQRLFTETELDISNISTELELVEILNKMQAKDEEHVFMYKIILVGERNFEIDTFHILKLLENDNIVKLKNQTKLKYNLEKIKDEKDLKGYFVKEILKRLEENPENKEIIEQALEIGLDSFN